MEDKSINNKPEASALTWFFRVAVILGLGLGLANAWLDIPYSDASDCLSFALLVPLIFSGVQYLNFPIEYTLLGGMVPDAPPANEEHICTTKWLSISGGICVGAGQLALVGAHFGFIVFIKSGYNSLYLFPSGILFRNLFREVYINVKSFSRVERISSLPKVFVIYHESEQLRSPIVFTDQKFFDLASQLYEQSKTSAKGGAIT